MSIADLEEPEGDQDDKKHKHLGKPVSFSIYFRKRENMIKLLIVEFMKDLPGLREDSSTPGWRTCP